MTKKQNPAASVTFDWGASDSPSNSVITAIATSEDVHPTDIAPLYGTVDPEALDTVVTSMGPSSDPAQTKIEFTHHQYRVILKANGQGYLYNQGDASQSTEKPSRSEIPNQAD